jgi:G3E family GTPase
LIFDLEEDRGRGIMAMLPAAAGGSPRQPSHGDQGIWSHTIVFSRPLPQADFCRRVESIPPAVFRAKGMVDLTDPCHTVLFQYVAGRYELSEFHGPGDADRFLVFIGQAKDHEPIVDELDRLFAEAPSGEKNWPRREAASASLARDYARSHSGASPCG